MLISQRPELTEEYIDTNRSKFVIEPLEPGFGYTLGNSLRRTLLSSIPGAAVTSIKIDGVLHEFTTINGVKENVSEIILNIKDLVLSSDSDEPVVMQLAVEGPGDVTAGDIEAPLAKTKISGPGAPNPPVTATNRKTPQETASSSSCRTTGAPIQAAPDMTSTARSGRSAPRLYQTSANPRSAQRKAAPSSATSARTMPKP